MSFFFFPARAHDARSNAGDDEKVYNDGDSDELQAVGVGKKKDKKAKQKEPLVTEVFPKCMFMKCQIVASDFL